MKKNVKKVVAALMATMTIMSTVATTSLAAGNGRIGVVSYSFYYGTQTVYVGDCNQDGDINVADLVALMNNQDHGWYFFNAWAVYDCNGDGYVNSKDVDALKSYIISH